MNVEMLTRITAVRRILRVILGCEACKNELAAGCTADGG